MDKELRDLLQDPNLGDAVKVALIPELTKPAAAPRTSGVLRLLNNGPAIAALASICTLAISEAVKVYLAEEKSEETITLDASDKAHEQSIERLKFQFDVIRSALDDDKSPQERAETLLFLTEIELLDGLNKEALVTWGESESVPGLRSPSEAPRGLTAGEYRQILGADAYGTDTAPLIPSQADLEAALGCPVRKDNSGQPENPAIVSLELPFAMPIAWNKSTQISRIRVHEAVAPFMTTAFELVFSRNLQDTMAYGGSYNPRRLRSGGWSTHSWGAEIDINPDENRLRMDEDQFRMHPGVVAAFKEAGFAWKGDLGSDAMSFVISKTSLEAIRQGGYTPLIRPEDCLK